MSEKSGFEELMSQVDAIVTHPLTPWLALGVIALFWILSQVSDKIPEDPIERLKRTFGADQIPHGIALIGVLLWGALVLLLTIGLITLLIDIVWNTAQPVEREAKGDFRFLLTKTAALTAVLGAMIALPFTALRLKLTAAQTRHAEDVLFNEKLNDANTDLHARYQTSKKQDDGTYIDIWTDDIIRRNGAIDRLAALAVERPAMAPRIARILCVYLKEMSKNFLPQKPPSNPHDVLDWAQKLTVSRSDMETAAHILGSMHSKTKVSPDKLQIDLSGVNLQAIIFKEANFEHANLAGTYLDGAELNAAKLKSANLSLASLNGASLIWSRLEQSDLQEASFVAATLNGANMASTALHGASLNLAKLFGTNLEAAELWGATFKQTQFDETNITDADFFKAEFHETFFEDAVTAFGAQAHEATFRSTDLSQVFGVEYLISGSFGDGTVILSNEVDVPNQWPNESLSTGRYVTELNLFKKDPDAYLPPQLRKK